MLRRLDVPIVIAVLALLSLGLIMVYSSSTAMASLSKEFHMDGFYFLKRQLIFVALGLGLFVASAQINFTWLWKSVPTLLAITMALLVAVLFTKGVKGAHRWFEIPGVPFKLQVGEFARITWVALWARVLTSLGKDTLKGTKIIAVGAVPLLMLLLIVIEPDFGSALMLVGVAVSLLFIAGVPFKFLFNLALPTLGTAVCVLLLSEYRRNRVIAFLDPWADQQGAGMQMTRSIVAFGSGGADGLGVGLGKQKLFYLPEIHNDFIFAAIGEELGFLGALFVVVCFTVIVVRGLQAALRQRDRFATLLATGFTSLIVFQVLFHMSVVMGLVPTKGITLPLVSYGGSSMLTSMIILGFLARLRADVVHRQVEMAPVVPSKKQANQSAHGKKTRDTSRSPSRTTVREPFAVEITGDPVQETT